MTEKKAWANLQEALRSDLEMADDFASLIGLAMNVKIETRQAMIRLRRGWFYCMCPADESAMKYLKRKPPGCL